MSFDADYFEGHMPRRCGEHRTVGPHRAWCHTCSEWCYPNLPCAGCGPSREELEARVERYRLAWMSARRRALYRSGPHCTCWDAAEWCGDPGHDPQWCCRHDLLNRPLEEGQHAD